LDQIKTHILKASLYFDIFKYPLKIRELSNFIPAEAGVDDIEQAVRALVSDHKLHLHENEFVTVDGNEDKVTERKKANKYAEEKMEVAYKNGRLIGNFPFVRGVYLSGSLSKGVMKSDSDIDYFIITAENRLWLCRMLLVIYKRIILLNSRMEFCINYFKSESKLEIEDENMFTAVELATMIPVVSIDNHKRMMASNPWITSMVHGYIHRDAQEVSERDPGFLSKFLEKLFGGSLGDRLETKSMELVKRRNARRYSKKLESENYQQMFRSNDHTAKVHPLDHQGLVLNKFSNRLEQFNLEPEIALSNG